MDSPPPPRPPGPPPAKPPGPPPSRPPGPPPSRPESTGNPFDRSSSSYAADDYSVYGNKDSDDVVYNTPSRSTSVNSPPAPAQSLSRAPSVSAPSSPTKSAVPSSSSGGGGSEYYDTYEDGKTGNVPMASNPLRNMMKKANSNISRESESGSEMSSPKKAPPALPSEAAPTNSPPPTPAKGAPPPAPRAPPAAADEGTEGSFVTVDTGGDSSADTRKAGTSSPMHPSGKSAPSSPTPAAASSGGAASAAAAHEEPVEEVEDLSQPEVRVKDNMPTARGLIPVCKVHTEIPSDVLARLLLKNESVTGQFDFFYPRRGFSKRFTFFLCVCTLGLYLVVLAVQSCLHWLRNALCKCMACADSIYYTRGKLIVTSRGRLICWFLEVDQQHNADNQTHYKINQNVKIFNADDVAQISLSYSDRLLFLNCCYGDFSTGIDIAFHAFDHLALPWSRYMYTNHPSNYLLNLSSYIKNSVAYSVYNSITYGKKDPLVIRVVSNCWDKSYDGEYGLEPLEDLCKLNDALCKAMGNRATYHPNKTTPHTTDPIKRNNHTFMSARDMMDAEIQKTYGAEHIPMPGVKDTCTDLTNFTMVDDDGNVTIPARWLPLSPGEEVVAAVGQYYKPTCCDKIRAVATLGLYYCRYLRSKLRERSALILTTHRVVEIMLFQSRGKIPAELGSVDVIVRSYFPKQVQSGYVRSGDGHTIESAIYCSFGQLVVSLPSTQLQFAQKMQLAASREHPLSLKEVEGLLPDNAHLQPATMTGLAVHKDANGDADASDTHKNSNGNKIKYEDAKMSPTDQILLPLMPGETLLHRFQGGSQYKPCCLINFGLFKSYLCTFATASPNVVANCGWVCLVQALTCSRRPLLTTPACLLTTHTMYYISNTSHINSAADAQTIGVNYSGCCGSGYRLEPFILTWLPIRKLHDHELQITTAGSKPFDPLLCCTPPPKSVVDRYDLLVNSSEGISYPLSEDVPFKAWNKDIRVTKMQNVLSAVQTLIAKE